jgi:hypothetical protein
MRHEESLIGLRVCAANDFTRLTRLKIKKPGGRNESSSRVEVMDWNYEKLS